MPHWINISGRSKGAKFRCSECKGECFCFYYGANKNTNKCNYRFCPRCGMEMDLENQTWLIQVEESIGKEQTE